MNLYDTLKVGYSNNKTKQAKMAEKHGYILDKDLTNHNHQVYFSPTENKLLYNGNGTQNNSKSFLTDWKTNAMIGLGMGKQTQRYKEEKNALEKARKKYNPSSTTITGHSQFRFIGSRIAKPEDDVITFNGASIGGKIRDNEKHYRVDKDIISAPSMMDKNTTSIQTKPITFLHNHLERFLHAHNLNNIKNNNILI